MSKLKNSRCICTNSKYRLIFSDLNFANFYWKSDFFCLGVKLVENQLLFVEVLVALVVGFVVVELFSGWANCLITA